MKKTGTAFDDLLGCDAHKILGCGDPNCKHIKVLKFALARIVTIDSNLVGEQYEAAFKGAIRIAEEALYKYKREMKTPNAQYITTRIDKKG